MSRDPEWISRLPILRPKTSEEIMDDFVDALANDTGFPKDILLGSRRKMTPEEIDNWRKVHFGG